MSDCLLDEEFKSGQGIPFIALEGEGEHSSFRLTEEAKEFLQTLKAPVALASIVGKYRTGKSLLVNRMLLDIKGGGFQVGATVNSCTKGLWIWNKPLRCKQANGEEVQLLVIDTEGIGSLDADADHDAKIFALALLLSSYFIYNSVGSIDENALNALSLVVELTKHIKTKSEKDAGGEPETGAEFANFFPSFLWVIRDFTLQLVDENGNSFAPKTYLERSLTPMQGFSEGVEVKNRIRRMLLAFFPNRDCVTLKRPVEDESLLQTLDDAEWSDFRPEFIEQVKILRRKIYTSAPPKMLNGKVLDGFMISHLADQYAKSINSGASLNIGDAWTQVSASKNVKAVQDAVDTYEDAARALEKAMPLSAAELESKHAEMLKAADKCFRMECMGTGKDVDEYVAQMTDKINECYLAMRESNSKIARAAALEAIEKSYAELASQVETKKFKTFKDFEAERQVVRKAYLDTCPETPAKLEVLSTFMEAKIPLAASAIAAQADERAEQALAEKAEEMKKVAHELESQKKQAAADIEELSTKLKQAEEQLSEVGGREKELKEEVERQRAAHSKQLEEETGALKKELESVKDDLETQLTDVTKKAKDAAAKANSESTEMTTKIALLEQQSKFADEEKSRLSQQHADASAELEKLRAANKQLDADLSNARKEASAQADSTKDVEKKLAASVAASAEEVASVKAALAAAQAAAADKEKSLGASAAELTAQKDKTAAELAEAKAKIAAAAEAAGKLEKELAASKEEAAAMLKGKQDVEKTLEEYKASAGDTAGAANKEIEALKKSLAEAADKAAELSKEKAAAEERAEAAQLKASEADAAASAEKDKAAAAEAAAAAAKEQATAAEERAGKAEAAAQTAAETAAKAASEAAAAKQEVPPSPGGRGDIVHSEEMRNVLERQSRMQAEFNEESTKLNERIFELEKECDRYKTVIHRLSNKVEAANAAGFAGPDGTDVLEKIGASFGSAIRSQTSKFGKENGTPQSIPNEMSSLSATRNKEGNRESYVMVDSAGESVRNSRPRNEIVFKPNVQPDVFSQVAKQSGQTTEQVMRNHEAGKSSGGVAAVGVGSGEKFSFARLRQAISKKVSGAINKVDEWADNVEGVLMGTPNGSVNGAATATPPRPSDGGFYTDESAGSEDVLAYIEKDKKDKLDMIQNSASAFSSPRNTLPVLDPKGITPEQKADAAKVLQGLRSPDNIKVAAGREKIAQMKASKDEVPHAPDDEGGL